MEIDGYFAETPYPPHLPQAFTPAWIDHVLRHGGHVPNRAPRGAFRYLDLGCGNGLQTILMAAGCPEGQFVGTDANASAIARAQAQAEGLGIGNVSFRHETFAETLEQGDAGFDYLAGLGLLTWVSPENRALIFRIAGRLLAPGGAACFGYNTLPGRGSELILQRILRDAAREQPGAQPEAMLAVLDRMAELAEVKVRGLQDARIRRILSIRHEMDRTFLPHEYLSEHWTPLHAEDVIRAMEAENCVFAGSLTLVENRHDFILGKAARAAVEAEFNVPARERLIDLLTDQGFRRDVYLRRPAHETDTRDARDTAWIAATGPAEGAELSLATSAGRLNFDNPASRETLATLQDGPMTVAEAGQAFSRADRLNALDALMAAELVIPVEPPAEIDADGINAWLAERGPAGTAPCALVTRHGARQAPISLLKAINSEGSSPDPKTLRRIGL